MKITKIAASSDNNSKDIAKLEKSVSGIEKDLKEAKNDIKKIRSDIGGLNLGQRRFWEQKTVFTSLQRKIERFEKIEAEWKKYKNSIDGKIRSEIERRTRSRPA